MKRIACTVIASALVVGGSALGAAGSPAGSQAKPWLRLADTEPLTVRGVNFRVGEAVTVTATTREQGELKRKSKAARTSATGAFTVTLTGVDIEDCALAITAQGASGDRATLKFPPRPCGALF